MRCDLDEIILAKDTVIPYPTPRHKMSSSQRIDSAIIGRFAPSRCCVYFIGNHRAVKIGVSHDISRRLGEVDRGYEPVKVLLLIPGSYSEERELHDRFGDLSIRKEWFLHTDALAEFIARERAKFL